MFNSLVNLFPLFRRERKPAERGTLIALSGAVLIGTEDGHTVVITPGMARKIAPLLPQLAQEAERESIGLTT